MRLRNTLSAEPTRNPKPASSPMLVAMNNAPVTVPKKVPAKYVSVIAMQMPMTAITLRAGFFTVNARRTIRKGAVKKAAIILIG